MILRSAYSKAIMILVWNLEERMQKGSEWATCAEGAHAKRIRLLIVHFKT